MKISEFTDNSHIDEISATDAGAAAGKATKAVGAGVKKAAGAIGSGIKNFAKGFGQGVTGKTTEPATKANPALDSIKASIAKLNPKQLAALRTQIAKKAGVK
jgi:hypothetical protein